MKKILTVFLFLVTQAALFGESDLEKNSPFIPYDYKKKGPGVAKGGQIEFRGVVDFVDDISFGFYDKQKKEGFWVKKGDPKAPVLVDDYNPRTETVSIRYRGKALILKMPKREEKPIPVNPGGRAPALRRPGGPERKARPPKADSAEKSEGEPKNRRAAVYSAFKKYLQEKRAREEGQ